MIQDTIRDARKQAGMSQEELALQMHVVRQTVSKWERGLSVPDASMIPELSRILHVPVNRLLELDAQEGQDPDMKASLETARAKLEEMDRERNRQKLITGKREHILFLAFLSLMIALGVRNEILSAAGISLCALGSLVILYRNLPLMTGASSASPALSAFRTVTIFSILLILLITAGIMATETGYLQLSVQQENLAVWLLITVLMVFCGWICPKLSWNRYVGLRLPWTVSDPQTWALAHRILGWISLPSAVFYTAAVMTLPDFGAVSATAVILWVAVPSVLSLVFWLRKYRHQ